MKPEIWAEIRRLRHAEKLSIRKIARQLKLHRNTVTDALKHDQVPPPPIRNRSSIVDAFQKDIDEILAETPDITAVRMHEELEGRGFKGKVTVVKDRLRAMRDVRTSGAYIRRFFHPGEAAEIDWASCGSVELGGRKRRLSAFVMTLCYSRMLYLEFTVSQVMEEFLRCHQNAFQFFRGCPRKLLYDNLKSVVAAREGRTIRLNPRFIDFSGYYLFKPIICNPASGWEKGRVERTIRYIRSNFLLGRKFRSLVEINAAAVSWRDEKANRRIHGTTGKRPIDLFADDRARLLALPDSPYDTRITKSVKVTSDCRVNFEKNTYSVPPKYVGRELTLRAAPTEVAIYDGPSLVARHNRSYEAYKDTLDPQHAREVLARKRRAYGQSQQRLFLALGPEAEKYLAGLVRTELSVDHHLRRILDLAATYGTTEVMGAIVRCLEFEAFSADYVEHIIQKERRRRHEGHVMPIQIKQKDLAEIDLPEQKLDHYDDILKIPKINPQEEEE